jgi:drug/metabolite transporter (DMT)-like permease
LLRVALVFLLGAAGISFAAIFVRLALPAPPIVTGFYRMLFAGALLGAWIVCTGRGQRLPWRTALLALAAGACFGGDLAFWNTAIVKTSVANATLLVNTTPLHVGLFSLLAWKESLGRAFVLGAALAFGGAALLLGSDVAQGALEGDLLALVAALFYSAYLLLMKAVRGSADAVPALFLACLGAAAALGTTALLRGDAFSGFPASSWAAFVGAALVSQLLGVLCIVWVLRYARATFASVALLAQPLGTAALGWVILGEALAPVQGLGGAAVLAGIALAARSGADPTTADR